jgi:hypothetical protein
MKLYDLELSGNCYKVRLFAALAQIHLDIIPVDFLAGAHKKSPLIELNTWGGNSYLGRRGCSAARLPSDFGVPS